MSLHARLTLLYTFTVGGILLVLGTVVYLIVSTKLTNDIDHALQRTAENIIANARAGRIGTIERVILPGLDQDLDIYVQYWNPEGKLEASSLNMSGWKIALDEQSLTVSKPVFQNTQIGRAPWRVLSVPLKVVGQNRKIGALQIGMNMSVVMQTQNVLLTAQIIGGLAVMGVIVLASWFGTRQALAPLESVTRTALQITHADDLSRRIPYSGPPNNEVGQLIHAFNQTLSRLENLFNSQRRFVADVGHELRTPLTVIKGNVDLMRRMQGTDDESLASIESEVDRLTRLVGDLLLLAQAESGKLPLAFRTVELDTVMLEVMQQMRVVVKEGQQLKLGDIDQVLVCGDQDRLKQVLLNLVGNAIKYTPKGGEIFVGLGKVNQMACLTVTDNGPGIPIEDMPHIFERFYRGEKSRTRGKDGKGFGLGLSIAYWIVRNHGGKIEVAARKPQGTIFTIWLPLAEGPCQDEKKPV
jgi:two-component system OmpR family sensor kinase